MRKDFKPKWAPITEVPIIPVHEDMGGRDEPDQHPVAAITGLADALDSKVDKATGKGLSTEDYTTAEKAKLSLIEDDAERNVVETVKVNGEDVTPDGDRAVWLSIPATGDYADAVAYNSATGEIRLLAADGSELSRVQTPLRSIITAAAWDEANTRLVLTKADGSRFLVPMESLRIPVVGDGVDTQTSATDDGVVVSLTQDAKDRIGSAVTIAGTQTVTGNKTFTGVVVNEGVVGAQWLRSTKQWEDTGQYSVVNTQIATPEGNSIIAYDDVYSQASRVVFRRYVMTPDHAYNASIVLRLAQDGTASATAPVHVQTDGSGNPLPTPSAEIVTGGMLAVDPQVVHTYGTESIAGAKTLTGALTAQAATFNGTLTENGAVSSKSVVTPAIQTVEEEQRGWYRVYTITVTTTVNHTLVLWSSPTAPVVASARQMGVLMVSIRGPSCLLKWHTGVDTSAELQKTALVCTELPDGGYEWSLWQKAEGAAIGRYLHRIAEYTMNGPSSSWTALNPTAEDAQTDLPSGDNITVYYSEAE